MGNNAVGTLVAQGMVRNVAHIQVLGMVHCNVEDMVDILDDSHHILVRMELGRMAVGTVLGMVHHMLVGMGYNILVRSDNRKDRSNLTSIRSSLS